MLMKVELQPFPLNSSVQKPLALIPERNRKHTYGFCLDLGVYYLVIFFFLPLTESFPGSLVSKFSKACAEWASWMYQHLDINLWKSWWLGFKLWSRTSGFCVLEHFWQLQMRSLSPLLALKLHSALRDFRQSWRNQLTMLSSSPQDQKVSVSLREVINNKEALENIVLFLGVCLSVITLE